ncbi:ornithine--oxo-acid transaminase, partial [Oligoflexia bacterium]|nr:ornithine--oxo-acid transaminase [Oligoflexia bacterium]
EKAEHVWVWDPDGNKYMDMLSAYSALNQGHRHPRIIQALKDQADKVTLTSRAFHVEPMGPFLKKVVEMCEMEMALPMNTGAEAVETAIKAARKWGYQVKGIPKDQAEIIVFDNNFHGRTTTIVGFSSEEQYREGFGPFTPGFKLVEYGDINALKAAITPNTAAILMEPIQGEGGILMPPADYLSNTRQLCDDHKMLFILDEIQTGLGRTGKLFAYQYEDVKPDMLILGKALGGGVIPVSAVVSSKEVLGVFKPGDHGSTFGGFPLACATALAALDVIVEEGLVNRAFELGQYFMESLQAMNSPHVLDIRGRGLLIGVEIKKESGVARPYCEKLMTEGILCKETHESVVRFAPPLTIKKEEIDWAMERIRKVLC